MIRMCTDHAITDLCVFFSLTLTKLIIIAFLLIHSYIRMYIRTIDIRNKISRCFNLFTRISYKICIHEICMDSFLHTSGQTLLARRRDLEHHNTQIND